MFDTWRSSTFRLRMPHRCSIGFRSGDILVHLMTFTFDFFRNAVVILEVCLGSLSCWNTAVRPSFLRKGFIFCIKMPQYILESMIPSMNRISLVPAALIYPPDHDATTTMLDCRQDEIILVLLTRSPPDMLDTIWAKQIDLSLVRPQNMLPVVHSLGLHVLSKLFASFFVCQLEKRLSSGTTAMQTNFVQCAAYGLSTDRPLNCK